MNEGPKLLRRRGRRGFLRRSVFVVALTVVLVAAPNAGGVPGDPTPPVVTPVYSPTLPSSGWYRGSVTLGWLVVDAESTITKTTGCDAQTFTTDTPGTLVTCTAESDGGIGGQSVTIRLDRTPPEVKAIAERGTDANGWYNRPLTVSYAGADATSGLSSCSPPTRYAGPDLGTASVVGSCSDKAGNVAQGVLAFKYDATPPSIFGTTATHGNRSAQISWRKSGDTKIVEVFRAPGRNGQGESGVYRGTANGVRDTGLTVGRKYEYRVIAVDDAANRAEQKLSLVATGALLSPTPGLKITTKSPPTLVWTPAKGATYYNVQLIFHGRKVLSEWPLRQSFRLRRTWLYKGRRYRLRPGVYRWYVWPGFGRISAANYGRPLGSSSFVVTK